MELEKVLGLADGLDGIPRDTHDALRTLEHSAAAIRALVEVVKCEDAYRDADKNNNHEDAWFNLCQAYNKLEALNDGLEV